MDKKENSGLWMSRLTVLALFMIMLIVMSPVAFALTISDLTVALTGTGSVNVAWKTDAEADSSVTYRRVDIDEGPLTNSVLNTSHNISVLGLKTEEYVFEAKSKDADGNIATGMKKFKLIKFNSGDAAESGSSTGAGGSTGSGSGTAGSGAAAQAPAININDIYPPAVLEVAIVALDGNSVKIRTEAGEESNVTIFYGNSRTIFDKSASAADYKLEHEVEITGLAANVVYFYQAMFCDVNGRCALSSMDSFTPANDNTAPKIVSININDNSYIQNSRIDVIGRTKPFSIVTLTTNGADKRTGTTDLQGDFRFPSIALKTTGYNTIKINVKDTSGRSITESYKIYVDNIEPKVDLLNMTAVSAVSSYTIKGTVSEPVELFFSVSRQGDKAPGKVSGLELVSADANMIEMKWAEVPEDDIEDYVVYRYTTPISIVEDNTFIDDKASVNIEYSYRIAARDKAGNIGEKSEPLVRTLGAGDTLTKDWLPVDLSLPKDSEQVAKGVFEKTLNLDEGDNVITITALDKAGNKWEESFDVFVDTLEPEIEIDTNRYKRALIPYQKLSGWANKPGMTIYVEVSPSEGEGVTGEEKEIYTAVSGSNCGDGSAYGWEKACPWDVMVTLLKVFQRTTMTEPGGGTNQEDEFEKLSPNKILAYGKDSLGRKSNEVPWEWVYATCSFGGGSWDVYIQDIFPQIIQPVLFMPDKPDPYVMLTLRFEYTGSGNDQKAKVTNVDVSQRETDDVELEKYQNFKITQPGEVRCSDDSSICYATLILNYDSDNMTLIDGLEKIESPLKITFNYQEEVDGKLVSLPAAICTDFSVQVDKRIPPGKINKKFLKGIEQMMENVVDGIDYVLKPINTIRSLVFVSCIGTWIYMSFEQKLATKSCKMMELSSGLKIPGLSADGKVDVEELAARAIGYADMNVKEGQKEVNPSDVIEGCNSAFKYKTNPKEGETKDATPVNQEVVAQCNACALQLVKLRKTEQAMTTICDRTFCPEAPTLSKHTKDYSDSIAIYEGYGGVQAKNVCEANDALTQQALDEEAAEKAEAALDAKTLAAKVLQEDAAQKAAAKGADSGSADSGLDPDKFGVEGAKDALPIGDLEINDLSTQTSDSEMLNKPCKLTLNGNTGTCKRGFESNTLDCNYRVGGSNFCGTDTSLYCCFDDKGFIGLKCTTDQGVGTCKKTTDCTGTLVPEKCDGSSKIQCCVAKSADAGAAGNTAAEETLVNMPPTDSKCTAGQVYCADEKVTAKCSATNTIATYGGSDLCCEGSGWTSNYYDCTGAGVATEGDKVACGSDNLQSKCVPDNNCPSGYVKDTRGIYDTSSCVSPLTCCVKKETIEMEQETTDAKRIAVIKIIAEKVTNCAKSWLNCKAYRIGVNDFVSQGMDINCQDVKNYIDTELKPGSWYKDTSVDCEYSTPERIKAGISYVCDNNQKIKGIKSNPAYYVCKIKK